ncbi:fatty-acid amide hydrolase 2-like [Phlebotomus argentipes]|uniref:fatty-acid amide hydrolase 2-like n=1 Tax=Phlebotomus argentipes TaxID=94469 RepID=UPI002892C634|nr:fatty-acid amide hydrolase 2-like [Phlebotomus argentipes]
MDILLRISILWMKFTSLLIYPLLIIHGAIFTPRKPLPPFVNCDLLTISANDLAKKIRCREVKSESVVRAYIARQEAVNPLINAIVENGFERAIEMAKDADKKCSEFEESFLAEKFPLLGVPVTIKEACRAAGFPITMGNFWRKATRSLENSEAVQLILNAGAIPLLVSNTPEFCYSWETNNFVTGRTLNPYDQRRSAGGSSGGEGALLGSGASLFGIAADTAGSIRCPAMYNGVFGHKPTPGVISNAGMLPDLTKTAGSDYMSAGPMCRYARDLPLITKIMAGPKAIHLKLDDPVPVEEIRIFFKKSVGSSLFTIPTSKDMSRTFDEVIQHFSDFGMKPMPLDVDMSEAPEFMIAGTAALKDIPSVLEDPSGVHKTPYLFLEMLKSPFGCSRFTFGGMYLMILVRIATSFLFRRNNAKYAEKFEKLRSDLVSKLGSNGVFIFPTSPRPALRHHEYYTMWYGLSYTFLINMLGFPGTSVPIGFSSGGLPLGVQVVAGPYQDRLCFSVAHHLERAFGGWKPPK